MFTPFAPKIAVLDGTLDFVIRALLMGPYKKVTELKLLCAPWGDQICALFEPPLWCSTFHPRRTYSEIESSWRTVCANNGALHACFLHPDPHSGVFITKANIYLIDRFTRAIPQTAIWQHRINWQHGRVQWNVRSNPFPVLKKTFPTSWTL